jgi:hypothetical protein
VVIKGGFKGPDQSLPALQLKNIHTWVLDDNSLVRIPIENEKNLGFVYPGSLSELWVPEGSPIPAGRAGVSLLVHNGKPRYLMPAIDSFVDVGGHLWRNRGVASQPLAHVWQTFDEALFFNVRLNAYVRQQGSGAWKSAIRSRDISKPLTRLIEVLADPPEELQVGMYFLMTGIEDVQLPAPGGAFRIFLAGDGDFVEEIEAASAAAESDDTFSDLIGAQNLSLVDCAVQSVASAGDSIALPDAYKRLFK